jgi:hypothetical protein
VLAVDSIGVAGLVGLRNCEEFRVRLGDDVSMLTHSILAGEECGDQGHRGSTIQEDVFHL